MASISSEVASFIKKSASLRHCLAKGLINYSALARYMKNAGVPGSHEAMMMAARRYKPKVAEKDAEPSALFARAQVEIKNNVTIHVLKKDSYPDALIGIERAAKAQNRLFFAIEGKSTITVVLQQEEKDAMMKSFRHSLISLKEGLVLMTFTSAGIRETPGAVAYIAGLFAEHGVNIEEFMSCHDDTLIVIEKDDLQKAMGFIEL